MKFMGSCFVRLLKGNQLSPTILLVSVVLSALSVSVPADTRKYHPGHYVSMNRWDNRDAIYSVLRPGVVGVQIRYSWRELEPAKDQYDFSAIHADLNVLSRSRRQLVMFLLDKSFDEKEYTPEYLGDGYTVSDNGFRDVAKRWDPYVVNRITKLVKAIAAEFDSHPNFEGLAFQESALGLPVDILERAGYTPEKYRDALIDQLQNAAAAFSESRVFWYMNFLARKNRYMADIRDAVVPFGVAIGGPDILPGKYGLELHTYPVLKETKGVRFNSAQNESFRYKKDNGKYWSPQEIFEYARTELGLCYIFWNRVNKPSEPGSYSIEDAYPVIGKHPEICAAPMPPRIR